MQYNKLIIVWFGKYKQESDYLRKTKDKFLSDCMINVYANRQQMFLDLYNVTLTLKMGL